MASRLLLRKHNCRNLPPIVGFLRMGGAAEAEKTVFGWIGADPQRFDGACARAGQAMGNIALQIETIMTLPVRGREKAAVLET